MISGRAARLACVLGLLMTATVPALPGAGAMVEELAVVQAIATILNKDARSPYDYLYFESEFTASAHVASSMANPDRTQYCGLTREQGQALVNEIASLTSKPLVFDSSVAEPAGLKLGHKKLPRFRYLIVSRVVFDAANQHAWLAVDLNGETGSILRLDKVEGQWSKSARCGGWMKTVE
jgi:hypothetical protein